MTTNHDANEPAELAAAFVAAFNAGNSRAVEELYEDLAVLVPRPGHPVTGPQRLAANGHLLRLGLPIHARPRHVYAAGDTALLVVDWSIQGTAPDGNAIHLEGTATDVARRGPDGYWRYLIDNPFGTG
jgi:ketosteroid isomerase-like protein